MTSALEFNLIPNYDRRSRRPYCSVSGRPKSEGDLGVFRGGLVDHEGFYDVGQYVIERAATQIGWVSAAEHEAQSAALAEALAQIEALTFERDSANEARKALTLANAELYTQLDAVSYEVDEDEPEDDEAA